MIGTGASAIQFVPAIQPRGRRSCTSSSARRRGSCPHRTAPITRGERAALPSVPGGCSGWCAAAIYSAREAAGPRLRHAPAADAGCPSGSPRRHLRAQVPDPALRAQARRRTTRWAASGSCSRTTTTRRCGEPNVEVVTERHRGDHGPLDRHRRRRASARSTRSSSAPASRSPTCRSASIVRGPAARRSTEVWAGQPAGLPRARPCRASRTCSCCSGPTPGSATTRWST